MAGGAGKSGLGGGRGRGQIGGVNRGSDAGAQPPPVPGAAAGKPANTVYLAPNEVKTLASQSFSI